MSFVASAVVGGLVTAGSAAYSANQARKGVNAQIEAGDRASALEQQSADKQLALQREIWEKQQADQLPYLQQGQAAINKLGSLMGFEQKMTPTRRRQRYNFSSNSGENSSPIESNNSLDNPLGDPFESYLQRAGLSGGQFNQNNPQYQFLLKQGQQALDRSAAARGMGYSGAQMKAAQQFGQGLASQQYDKEYDRAAQEFGNYYNRLAALAQGGQQTAQSLGGMGNNYATGASNTLGNLSNAQTSILGQQANARASGYAANANAINQGLNSLTNLYALNKIYG